MLTEVRVAELGLFADLTLVLGPGLTALTGETGAGKTLVVDAIELLLGEPGRSGAGPARSGRRPVSRAVSPSEGEAGDDLILARTRAGLGPQPRLRRRAHGAARAFWPRPPPDWSTCTASTPGSRCCRHRRNGRPSTPLTTSTTER